MIFKKSLIIAAATLVIISSIQNIFACTSFVLTAKDNTVMVTRTMEFAIDMQANIRSYPRDHQFVTTNQDGSKGLSWQNKYGYVYLDAFQINTAVDGMNEAGLSFGALLFPNTGSQYQVAPKGKERQSIPYINFGDWVLGNFNNVAELKKALSSVYVTDVLLPQFQNTVFPLHFYVTDASGKGIIIEYVGGKLNVYDDKIGVLTNAPPYDWQLTNLRNYVNLSPYTVNPITIGNMTFASSGQGSGMHGLPGDISPPSRFVKMVTLKSAAFQPADPSDELNLAQHIINNVDIPLGLVRAKEANGQEQDEYTQWTVFKDLTHRVLFYHTYTDMALHAINLNKINFNPNAAMLKMPISPDPATIIDNTDVLMQSATNN